MPRPHSRHIEAVNGRIDDLASQDDDNTQSQELIDHKAIEKAVSQQKQQTFPAHRSLIQMKSKRQKREKEIEGTRNERVDSIEKQLQDHRSKHEKKIRKERRALTKRVRELQEKLRQAQAKWKAQHGEADQAFNSTMGQLQAGVQRAARNASD
ncbi:Hypothetical predicted protein [Lecanosticta acicola]|uniref:Uncharacterized protein n=1 Tax=Lecanosticta acicola TaxID=111012 RepID=A0AAI8YYQ6_9PEZI|nr:Hypothetical predicted protein [Lecanosticta acicola]